MSTYLLVHARWYGAWCWDRLSDRLRRAGNTVVTPDRAGLDEIRDLVETQAEPVVLVGHSSSGMIISALGELVPHRVRLLVYVSAFLLPNGITPPDIAAGDSESLLREHLVVDPARGTVTVTEPDKVFMADCVPVDATWAASRLVAEPLLPPGDRCVILTDGNFGSVPRAYVECLNDRALGPAAQRRMHTMTRCRHVYQLAADHSPFLSDPDGLTDCLLDATARFSRGDKDRCPGEAELADIRIRAETA